MPKYNRICILFNFTDYNEIMNHYFIPNLINLFCMIVPSISNFQNVNSKSFGNKKYLRDF